MMDHEVSAMVERKRAARYAEFRKAYNLPDQPPRDMLDELEAAMDNIQQQIRWLTDFLRPVGGR